MGREQLGPYTLSWPEGVFPLGGDALALGEFATVRPRWRVCDLGTGSGALLLMLARRAEGLSLTGVERDPLAARTARDNLAANGLPGEIALGDWREAPLPAGAFDLVVSMSAREGQGLQELEQAVEMLFPNDLPCDGGILTNARQAAAVDRAGESLSGALRSLEAGMTPDAVLVDVEDALDALGQITGKVMREEITNQIFSRFCVGK